MRRLPHWCVNDKFPAFLDTESATAIEQTAKVYGAMQTMIDEYNKFVENVNASLEEFEKGMKTDYDEFTVSLRQEFQDFIDTVDLRLSEAETYMKNNIVNVTEQMVSEAIKNGTIRIAEQYDEVTESYNINVTGGV